MSSMVIAEATLHEYSAIETIRSDLSAVLDMMIPCRLRLWLSWFEEGMVQVEKCTHAVEQNTRAGCPKPLP